MVNTFESLYAFAHRLIAALRDDDFSPERFARMDQLQRDQLDAHDQMVSIAYDALGHYATWSAWLKVWISTKLFGDIWLLRSILKYLASGDRRILETLDDVPTPPFDRVMRANVNFADAEIQAAHQGRISHDEAANRIFARLRDSDWLPHHTYKWGVPAVRHNDFSRPDKLPLAVMWGKTLAPTWVRRDLFDFPVGPLLKAKALEALSRVN
jgi:tetracycline 7-halogenase / FADH2 O2-dependent halogenase